MSHFHTPWKRQKTIGFLMFSEGTEIWHWTKNGLICTANQMTDFYMECSTKLKWAKWLLSLQYIDHLYYYPSAENICPKQSHFHENSTDFSLIVVFHRETNYLTAVQLKFFLYYNVYYYNWFLYEMQIKQTKVKFRLLHLSFLLVTQRANTCSKQPTTT